MSYSELVQKIVPMMLLDEYHGRPYTIQEVGRPGEREFYQATRHWLDVDKGRTGWKFHVSVHADDIEAAWHVVAGALMEHKVGCFKVTMPDVLRKFHDAAYSQAGKIFSIADFGENWEKIIPEIERKLECVGVRPSHVVKRDRPLTGSQYFHYRHDGMDKAYIGAEAIAKLPPEQRYNPTGAPDPFANFDVRSNIDDTVKIKRPDVDDTVIKPPSVDDTVKIERPQPPVNETMRIEPPYPPTPEFSGSVAHPSPHPTPTSAAGTSLNADKVFTRRNWLQHFESASTGNKLLVVGGASVVVGAVSWAAWQMMHPSHQSQQTPG